MKKNNKKTAIFLSSLLLVSGVAIGANMEKIANEFSTVVFADEEIYNGFKYVVSDGCVTITGYTEELDLTNVVIPEEIDGKPVTALGNSAFEGSKVEKVMVGTNVTTLGDRAFAECKSLKELNLGKNVKKLGKEVLASPYYGPAMQITKLIVSDNIEEVGENLYGRNSNHQTQITTLEVPASVTKVLPVFYNRSSLKVINAEEGGKSYSSEQGVLYNADKTTLVRCPVSTELEKYEVNEATETIGDNAFDSCQSLKELNLGKNVKKLGKEVLASPYYGPAMQITKLIVSDNIEEVGENLYGRNSNHQTQITTLEVPASVIKVLPVFYNRLSLKEINAAEGGKSYSSEQGVLYNADKTKLVRCPASTELEKYEVNEATETIGDNAFDSCQSLKELNLGKNVKKLGKEVLASPYYGPAMQITKLIVSDNIEEVGESTYGRNSNHQTQITTLEVPASVTKVLPVFYNRSSLKEINAEEGSKSYSSDQGVLYNADKTTLVRCPVSTELEKYEVNEATETIGDNAFDSCQSLKELNLGKNVKKLGKEVLASPYYGPAMQITKLIVSDNIEEVGESTYGRNSNHQTQITTLEVPASVTKVLPVFYNRLSLKEINAEEGGKSYSSEQGVLYNADKTALVRCPVSTELEKYEVNEATEIIGDNAFDSCQSLKELNLGKNVKNLGKEVLASPYYGPAMQITKLIVSDNIEEVGESTYGRNSNHQTQITTLEVPASVTKVLPVFYNRSSLKEINAEEGGKGYSSEQGVLYNADKTTLVRCPASTELEKYEVNEATEIIGDNAFDSCKSLKELNLGKNVKTLGKEALASPYYGPVMQITKLIVSDNILIIGDKIFGRNNGYQTSISVLEVPASVENIPAVFYNKSTLKEINVEEGGERYSSYNGVLYNGDKTVLIKCPRSAEASEYKIADETTTVSSAAFEGTGHKGIYFPAGIKIIGKDVFNPNLKIIYGYKGTVAETYANEYGFGFVSLGEFSEQPPVTTKPSVTTPSVTTAKPPVTTPSVTTAKPPVTTPSVTTAKPPVTTPSVTTAKPSVTTPAITTTKPQVTTPVTTPAEPPVSGDKNNYDVDGNGKIDIMDLLKLKIYLLS